MTSREKRRVPARRRRGWRRFVARYGWRAYALPLLSIITIAALTHTASSNAKTASGSGSGARHTTAHTGRSTQVDGLDAATSKYQQGTAPAPVTIQLAGDVTSCSGNQYAQLILVSISKQHLWACAQQKQVSTSAVTTGKPDGSSNTPTGSWRVVAKERDRYLTGPGYRDYVNYWMPFSGDFGLHDASWQTMPFGSPQYRTQGSHGCVHVPTSVMAWLYRWAVPGQTVVTVID
jgi:lipoprotein-anchoring transpeptidase ErfK/SrfK